MQCEFTAFKQPECRGMVLEQGPAAPAIERPNRGNPRWHAIELATEMIEDLRRNELPRVERSASHLEETNLESERQPVQVAAPFPNDAKFTLVESEEVLDLERGQCLGKPLLTKIAMFPMIGRRLFYRAG